MDNIMQKITPKTFSRLLMGLAIILSILSVIGFSLSLYMFKLSYENHMYSFNYYWSILMTLVFVYFLFCSESVVDIAINLIRDAKNKKEQEEN